MGFGLGSIKKIGKKALSIGTLGASDMLENIINPKKPKQPKIPEPEVIPIADEAGQRKARRRSIAAQQARHGRSSTILTSEKESLG